MNISKVQYDHLLFKLILFSTSGFYQLLVVGTAISAGIK